MRQPWLLLLGWMFPLSSTVGCGFAHRLRRFPAPVQHVAAAPAGDLAAVSVLEGGSSLLPFAAEPYNDELSRSMLVTKKSTILIEPMAPDTEMRVLVRSVDRWSTGLTEIHAVTGAREREVVDEVRFLPRQISTPYALSMRDLTNVYNGYPLVEDDLIVVELSNGESVERYLFSNRTVGLHVDPTLDLMLRTPLSDLGEGAPLLSPVLALGVSFGYRFANRNTMLTNGWDLFSLQFSLGIGSPAYEGGPGQPIVGQIIDQSSYSLLGGGGVRILEAVTVQTLVNLKGLSDSEEAVWTLGVGLDTLRIARFTRNAIPRLFRDNTLSVSYTAEQ